LFFGMVAGSRHSLTGLFEFGDGHRVRLLGDHQLFLALSYLIRASPQLFLKGAPSFVGLSLIGATLIEQSAFGVELFASSDDLSRPGLESFGLLHEFAGLGVKLVAPLFLCVRFGRKAILHLPHLRDSFLQGRAPFLELRARFVQRLPLIREFRTKALELLPFVAQHSIGLFLAGALLDQQSGFLANFVASSLES
jgi:hypothetical protein